MTSRFAVAVGDGGAIIRTIDGGVSWSARTSGTSAHLYDVTFADGGTGYATGQAGTILKTADGGISWIPLSSGTEALLAGVSFVDSNVGTAVGSEGAILRTADGGASWTGQTSGTTRSLNAVQLVTENTGYAVGEEIVLKTTDGGATWNAVTTPDSWYATLLDLSFIDADNGFIVGIGFKGSLLVVRIEWHSSPPAGTALDVSIMPGKAYFFDTATVKRLKA